eukprot:TRINITY_DN4166_c0_g1_i1.p1 TRINITY_DN4166_c0_g1~~TRINITY_DN4166_c0_g1_i1.p1  ORF type:complete len:428 (+),score=87.23 TRINITY_DN4166_c0_g1_i1:111-1286(+)
MNDKKCVLEPQHWDSEKNAREDGFLKLQYYAPIGDGYSVALAGADGSIDWWCVPDPDSPAYFDHLLVGDKDQWRGPGGRFLIRPQGCRYRTVRSYRRDSNILETLFITDTGKAKLTEGLNISVGQQLPWSELVRRIEGVEGEIKFEILLTWGNRFNNSHSWKEENKNTDFWHLDGLISIIAKTDGLIFMKSEDNLVQATCTSKTGSKDVIALLTTFDGPLARPSIEEIESRLDHTNDDWKRWHKNIKYDGPYSDFLKRSAMCLKLMIFGKSGAIVAAPTTSLPERIFGDKNWDYRYCWIRDAAYTNKAFIRMGLNEEAIAAFRWLVRTIQRHPPELKVMYTIWGEQIPDQTEIDCPGYRGSLPVVIGNQARDQTQLSMYGDLLETAWLFLP